MPSELLYTDPAGKNPTQILVLLKKTKHYIVGMSIGTLWLSAAGAGFSIQMLATAGTDTAFIAIAGVAAIAAILIAISVLQIVRASRLPADPPQADSHKVRVRFFWVVLLEVVGIMAINGALYFSGLLTWLVSADLIIVGVHFFPLAKLFGVPRYRILGAAFCVIPVATLLIIPDAARVGVAISRFLVPSLGCAVACWLTCLANQSEVRKLLSN